MNHDLEEVGENINIHICSSQVCLISVKMMFCGNTEMPKSFGMMKI